MLIPLIIGAGSGVAMWLFSTASQKIDAADKLDYTIKVEHLKFKSISELELALKIGIVNKAETTWKIKHPAIQVVNKGSVIAESPAINKTYQIQGNTTTYLDKSFFTLKTSKLAGIAGQIISGILKKWNYGAGLSTNIQNLSVALTAQQAEILKDMSVTIKSEVNGIPVVYTETDLSGLGYAPMSAIDRPITPAPKFDKYFSKPTGEKIVWRDKDVFDTAKLMVQVVEKDYKTISAFSQLMKRPTINETAKAIFDFIFTHIKYNLEEGEQLKSPLMSYHLGQRQARDFFKKNGYWHKDLSADCDDMAIFAASVLRNLNIPYTFEIASYKDYFGMDKGYSHVYVNIPLKNGNIIIDPVYYAFNQRKEYSRKFNYSGTGQYVNLNGMEITYLGAIGEADSQEELKIKAFLQKSRNELELSQADPKVIAMFDYALKYWDTPQREQALEKLNLAEKKILKQNVGFFGALSDYRVRRARHRRQPQSLQESNLDGLVWDNLKAYISKYKIPVAIGTALVTGLATYGIYKMVEKRKEA